MPGVDTGICTPCPKMQLQLGGPLPGQSPTRRPQSLGSLRGEARAPSCGHSLPRTAPHRGPESPVPGGQRVGSPGELPPPPRPARSCRRGTPGPESAATCPRPHCELRVALASSLESSPWVGRWRMGPAPPFPALRGHPPRGCLFLAGHSRAARAQHAR